MNLYDLCLLVAIRARGVVTFTWAWPAPAASAATTQAKRQAQAELYRQARMSNALPLGPATFRVAHRAVFDDHTGPALVARVEAALLP